MSGLGLAFLRRSNFTHPSGGSNYILSEDKGDAEVFRILMANGVSSDGVGITKEDAAAVTTFGTWFTGNTIIERFNELQFFNNVFIGGDFDLYAKGTFADCTNLKEVTIPPETKIVGYYAFRNCTNLTSIQGLENVEKLRSGVFQNCSSLAIEVNHPNLVSWGDAVYQKSGVTKVLNLGNLAVLGKNQWGPGAFRECPNLEEVHLPASMTSLGIDGCYICRKLKLVICEAVTPPTMANKDVFGSSNANLVIYVPDESVEAYKAAANWNTYAEKIKGISEYQG